MQSHSEVMGLGQQHMNLGETQFNPQQSTFRALRKEEWEKAVTGQCV